MKINKKLIVHNLIKFMSIIGNHKNMTGEEKKKWVLLRLKEELLLPEEFEELLIELIDYIVLIDNGQIKINQKIIKSSKKLFICC